MQAPQRCRRVCLFIGEETGLIKTVDSMFCDVDIYDDIKLKGLIDSALLSLELTSKPISSNLSR